MSYKNVFVPEIDQESWDAYLAVQRGGLTNMWHTDMVEKLSDGACSSDEALYCIKYYKELESHFGYSAWNRP